jgi:hypothetical protein
MPATAPDARSIRFIHLSLLAGVLLFLAVALFARSDTPAPGSSRLDVILLVVAIPLLLLSQVLRARLPARRATERADDWWQTHYTGAVIVWSLIEGASLMGIVGFWLTGNSLPLAATAGGVVLFMLTAPGRLAAE